MIIEYNLCIDHGFIAAITIVNYSFIRLYRLNRADHIFHVQIKLLRFNLYIKNALASNVKIIY